MAVHGQMLCSIFAALKAAANKELMLVPAEVVHLHVCLEAVWTVAEPRPQQRRLPTVGSQDYRQMKAMFNEVMLVNEAKVRSWIRETATAVNISFKPA